jgi:predicted TIM-barrel fold metal-dependent hydrolase
MIDTHTHIFPDKIAAKAAQRFQAAVGDATYLAGDFTLKDLKAYMKRCQIEAVVTFCMAERPEVVVPANNFLVEIMDNQTIFSFGTILPNMEDCVGEVRRIKEKRIKGIKFHSLFQPIRARDENLFPIYDAMAQAGMIAYFHVGKDPVHPSHPPGTGPQDVAQVKEHFPGLKIVAAHFGGLLMLDEARKWIIGRDIYIDTCWGPNIQNLEADVVVDLIRQHGVEKVLFATDYPATSDPVSQIRWFKDLPLQEKEKQLIFRENARRLLGL